MRLQPVEIRGLLRLRPADAITVDCRTGQPLDAEPADLLTLQGSDWHAAGTLTIFPDRAAGWLFPWQGADLRTVRRAVSLALRIATGRRWRVRAEWPAGAAAVRLAAEPRPEEQP